MLALAVCSLKGGVGKTSVVLGLASAALSLDIPTLVIDLDPQGDATGALDVLKTKPGIADVIVEPRRRVVEDAVVASGWAPDSTGRLDLLAGGQKLAKLDGTDLNTTHLQAMTLAARKLPHRYRVILIDCPPNLGGLTRLGLASANRALVVTEPGMFAISAADRALRLIEEVRRKHASDLRPFGIVLNRIRARVCEHDFRIAELERLYGPLVLPVRFHERAVIQQTQGAEVPLSAWKDPVASEIQAQYEDLLERAIRSSKIKGKR